MTNLGRLMVFLWSIFAMLMVHFYQCNLRAVLVAVEFEKPIDTPVDVVERGQPVYLNPSLHSYLKSMS